MISRWTLQIYCFFERNAKRRLDDFSFLHADFNSFPGMGAEQEAVAHRVKHHHKAAHGHGDAELVLAHPWRSMRVPMPRT